MTTTEFPITKFGGRWICDGPEGRFSARSKKEAQALLDATNGRYADTQDREAIATGCRCVTQGLETCPKCGQPWCPGCCEPCDA